MKLHIVKKEGLFVSPIERADCCIELKLDSEGKPSSNTVAMDVYNPEKYAGKYEIHED